MSEVIETKNDCANKAIVYILFSECVNSSGQNESQRGKLSAELAL